MQPDQNLIRDMIVTTVEQEAAATVQRTLTGTQITEYQAIIGYGVEGSIMMIAAPICDGVLLSAVQTVGTTELRDVTLALRHLAEQARSSFDGSGITPPSKWWIRIELDGDTPMVRSRGEYGNLTDLRGAAGRELGEVWGNELTRDVEARGKMRVERNGASIHLSGDLSEIATVDQQPS